MDVVARSHLVVHGVGAEQANIALQGALRRWWRSGITVVFTLDIEVERVRPGAFEADFFFII